MSASKTALKPTDFVHLHDLQLLGVADIAPLLASTPQTIQAWASRAPHKLPPRFVLDPNSNRVLWRWGDVKNWLSGRMGQPAPEPQKSTPLAPQKRRGAPSRAEKLAAANAGLSVADFRRKQSEVRGA